MIGKNTSVSNNLKGMCTQNQHLHPEEQQIDAESPDLRQGRTPAWRPFIKGQSVR